MKAKQVIFNEILQNLKVTLEVTIVEKESKHKGAIESPIIKEDHGETARAECSMVIPQLTEKIFKLKKDLEILSKFNLPEKNDVVVLGSLVEVFVNQEIRSFFLLPVSGGRSVSSENVMIFPIMRDLPIFQLLMCKEVGDIVTLPNKQTMEIKKIS